MRHPFDDPIATDEETEGLRGARARRTGLWAALMVALHGSGRSTEALAAARRLRHLVTDVGLDPGDRIRVLEALREDPDTLILVLDQHALLASLPSEKIEDGEVETVAGSVEATVDDNGTIHFDDATVLEADIEATNGIIHAVDTVLIPDPVNLKDLSD